MVPLRFTFGSALALSATLLATPACNRSDKTARAHGDLNGLDEQNVSAQLDKAARDLSDAVEREKREYSGRIRAELGQLDARIDAMMANAMNAHGDERRAEDELIRRVDERRAALQDDLATLGDATVGEWNDVKASIDRDLDQLRQSVRTASSRISAAPRAAAVPGHIENAPTNEQPVAPKPSARPTPKR